MLEAIRSLEPINLGWDRVCEVSRTANCVTDADCSAAALGNGCVAESCDASGLPCTTDADCDESCVVPRSILSFKQQVSLMDNPPHGCVGPVQGTGRSVDRAVLMLQVAGEDDPTPDLAPGYGPWMKLEPFQNGYDTQPEDNFISCMFDPIDDGSTEDDYYDPTDPNRRLGPSSTCYPEFAWSAVGDTDDPFDVQNYWRADGPGLPGSAGLGTWVETKVDLSRFRGRRVRLRFLTTGIGDEASETWEELFYPLNPDDCDDGWWLDDLEVTDTLANPATVSADVKDNHALPGCGADCSSITALLDADPVADAGAPLPAPGLPVELDASASSADACHDGILQYRFWRDGNGDGAGGDPADAQLRGWTDNPLLLRAPDGAETLVVDVRCSTVLSCTGSASRTLAVDCPSSGNLGGGSFETIAAPGKTQFVWTTPIDADYVAGDLLALPGYAFDESGSLVAATALPFTAAQWYLLKPSSSGSYCNDSGSWTSGGAGEQPGRDAALP